jgi:hypothetical protein
MEFQDAKGHRLKLIHEGVALLEESSTYRLAVQLGQAARDGWRAWFGRMELEWQQSSATFELRTGYWVGNQSLRMLGPQGQEWQVEVEVLPRKEKLSSASWGHLLRDLDEWMPGSTVGREGGLHGEVGFSGSSVAGIASVLGELVPAFEASIERLMRTPRERSVEHWTEAPIHVVRQAGRETLRWLVRHPDVCQSVLGLVGEGPQGRESLVPLRARKADLDHAANRYVAWLMRQVVNRLRDTAEGVKKGLRQRQSLDPDLERWCEARIKSLEEGAEKLEALLRRPHWTALSPEPASDSALLTLADDPVYARVHGFGQIFLSPRFQLPEDESLLAAPVRPSYDLYELWTFLALRRVLAEYMPGANWTSSDTDKLKYFDESPNGASYMALWPGHGKLGLHFNLEFCSFLAKKENPRRSISGARRPDLVVTWEPERGQGRWVCLDAKYRTAPRYVAEAFESAHIYRDALRWEGLGERGRCAGAVLLVPAVDPHPKAQLWFKKEFRDEHGAGVFCLTPGQAPPAELMEWLQEMLGWSVATRTSEGAAPQTSTSPG